MKRLPNLAVSKMMTIEILIEAAEYEKYDLLDLLARGEKIAKSTSDFQRLANVINGYRQEENQAGTWGNSPATLGR